MERVLGVYEAAAWILPPKVAAEFRREMTNAPKDGWVWSTERIPSNFIGRLRGVPVFEDEMHPHLLGPQSPQNYVMQAGYLQPPTTEPCPYHPDIPCAHRARGNAPCSNVPDKADVKLAGAPPSSRKVEEIQRDSRPDGTL
jgi:hypothetical protein